MGMGSSKFIITDFYIIYHRQMKKEKSDLRLRELKRWTKVKMWDFIWEFLWVDGMYCRWNLRDKNWEERITIMGHANQKVSEYGEIIY